MRKIAFSVVMLLITTTCICQNHEFDSLKKLLATPTDDTVTARRYIEAAWYFSYQEDSALFHVNKAYELSKKLGWRRGEAQSLTIRGGILGLRGSEAAGLRELLAALKMHENQRDSLWILRNLNYLGLLYFTIEDYQRSLHYLGRAQNFVNALAAKEWIWPIAHNTGDVYLKMANADSALYYFNLCYSGGNQPNSEAGLAWGLKGLGATHLLIKDYDLALAYLYKSLASGKNLKNYTLLAFTTSNLAKTYLGRGNRDSLIRYSRATMEYGKKSKYLPTVLDAYNLMSTAFKGTNADSTSKYLELAYNLKDSLTSAAKRNDIASMSNDEEMRQKELVVQREKEREERKRNIQFASIGIGLISFIIFALLLSRSIIVKSGLVRFLGVVTLLLVFEFINLLIHPFISDVTHHSPILMFLIMVLIAAMLVPAHHKLEHWITHQLVEKNKRIRLAAAKKTIATLER